jgi:HSP20 family protein
MLSPFGLSFGRLFDDLWSTRGLTPGGNGGGSFAPELDISEDEDAYTVSVELAGMRKEDVRIQVENNLLSISGEKKSPRNGRRRSERRFGAFYRSLSLPTGVDANAATAEMREGVLEITVPKTPEAEPKTLEIKDPRPSILPQRPDHRHSTPTTGRSAS